MSRTSTRRSLIAALALLPLGAAAQVPIGRRRVAFLATGTESTLGGLPKRIVSGLGAAGVPNVELRLFFAPRDAFDTLAQSAQEAVAWAPDAILAPGPLHAIAARDATRTIPVVFFAVPDPEAFGLVGSLARPGGNVTGSALSAEALTLKRLELAREMLPRARRVTALFRQRAGAPTALLARVRREVAAGAARLNLQLEEVEVEAGGGLGATLAAIGLRPPDAVVPFGPYHWEPGDAPIDPTPLLLGFERRARCLVIHDFEAPVKAGATVALYDAGSQLQAGIEVLARVLNGAPPAGIPVALPTRSFLMVNPSGARAIGLTIPVSVLIRANLIVDLAA